MTYGDGFLEDATSQAQNNLSGMLGLLAPQGLGASNFQNPSTSWGVPGYNPTETQGIPGYAPPESFDMPGFQGTQPWGISMFQPNGDLNIGGYGGSGNLSATLGQIGKKAELPKPATTPSTGAAVKVPTDSPYYNTALQAARNAGVDPQWFAAQIAAESGFDPNAVSPKGARGIAQIIPQYHPGVNPDDPNASLNYAAHLMAQYTKKYGGDIRWALAAYNAGESTVDAIYAQTGGQFQPNLLPAETQAYIAKVTGARAQSSIVVPSVPSTPAPGQTQNTGSVAVTNWGGYNAKNLIPDQYHEGLAAGYDRETALAICGPAAAAAFTRAYGHAPATLKDATEAARIQGLWDLASGMHGPASEVALMQYLGVPAYQGAVDWNKIAQEVQAGRPVALSAHNGDKSHYFVATGYDPATGKFEFGNSAGVLISSGGNTQYTPGGLGTLGMGLPVAAIYMGSP